MMAGYLAAVFTIYGSLIRVPGRSLSDRFSDAAGTFIFLVLGKFVDIYGPIGYARGFVAIIILSTICAAISYTLKLLLFKRINKELAIFMF